MPNVLQRANLRSMKTAFGERKQKLVGDIDNCNRQYQQAMQWVNAVSLYGHQRKVE